MGGYVEARSGFNCSVDGAFLGADPVVEMVLEPLRAGLLPTNIAAGFFAFDPFMFGNFCPLRFQQLC